MDFNTFYETPEPMISALFVLTLCKTVEVTPIYNAPICENNLPPIFQMASVKLSYPHSMQFLFLKISADPIFCVTPIRCYINFVSAIIFKKGYFGYALFLPTYKYEIEVDYAKFPKSHSSMSVSKSTLLILIFRH